MNSSANAVEVIIIGAGPAGASAATILADRGHKVLVLEREKFPRYHVGESLLPFTYQPLERLGLIDSMRQSVLFESRGNLYTFLNILILL